MSFVADTVLSGSVRLHTGTGAAGGKDGVSKQGKTPSSGLLAPLLQLVKDPLGAISGSREPEDVQAARATSERKQLLYLRMKDATTYPDWKAAANELDTIEGNDAWKFEDESSEYDVALVKARLEQFDEARTNCDVKRMLFLLRTTLTRGLGGMGDLRLYKHSHVGTKKLIERYIESAIKTLVALPDICLKQGVQCPVSLPIVLEGLLRTRQSFGRTALLLSGGGTFGMNHIGVVKCLWEQRLLPRVISGASAGSIVCAVLCTKTDGEIPQVLHDFCYGDLAVFEKVGEEEGIMEKAARFLKYGSLFDISHLEGIMKKMLGDITFQESYNRTRRILNITVSSASMYELPRLLNYVSAPDVMIWSAVCASCSVPLIFSAASLMAKDRKTGEAVPWNPSPNEGFIDGSVDNDLPMTRLAEMFNVNHFIVSQVNPHVVPFLAKEEADVGAAVQQNPAFSAGPGWMHNLASFAKGEALHRLDVLAEMGIFPNAVTKARSILNQRYSGDITIFPAISYTNFPKILSNPTTDYMLQCLLTGEQATWPKVSQIQNHVALELAMDKAVNQLLPQIHFSESRTNLRLLNLDRPQSQGAEASRARRMRKSMHFENHTALSTPADELVSPTFSRHFKTQSKNQYKAINRPYLPTHPPRKVTRSLDFQLPSISNVEALSSTDPEAGSSSDDEASGYDESDATELLSSPSPSHSPPFRLPDLWPSTRQPLFSSSNPTTLPSESDVVGHQSNPPLGSGSDATTATATAIVAPSSPELRYKRLFHPRPPTPPPTSSRIDPSLQQEIKKVVRPLTRISTIKRTESVPESQRAPLADLTKTSSLDEGDVGAFDASIFSPAVSPLTTRDDIKKQKLNQQQLYDVKEAERKAQESRRGSAQGASLAFDYSGTRGMMLRKKQLRNSGHGAAN